MPVRRLLLWTVALLNLWGLPRAEAIEANAFEESIGRVSIAAARALKSAHQLPQVVSGDEADDLLFGNRRHLAQKNNKDGFCEWKGRKCDISDQKMLRMLSAASSDIVQYLALKDKCALTATEEECSELGCTWNGQCSLLTDAAVPDALKQCMGPVGSILNTASENKTCKKKFKSQSSCNASKACTWDANQGCEFDTLGALWGVPSVDGLPEGFNEVIQQFVEWLVTRAQADNIFQTNDLEQILEWEPAPFVCPKNKTQLVCDAVGIMQESFVTSWYCARKYMGVNASPQACDADPLCAVDDNGSCSISQAVTEGVTVKLLVKLTQAVEDPLIRRMLDLSQRCAILKEDDCKGKCAWDGAGGVCLSNRISSVLGRIAKADAAPVCQLFGAVFASGCDLLSAGECKKNPSCKTNKGGTCQLEENFFKDATSDDKKLQKSFKRVAKTCERKKTKKACQ